MIYISLFIFSIISCEIIIRYKLLDQFKYLLIKQKTLFSVLLSNDLLDDEKESQIFILSKSLLLHAVKCFMYLFLLIFVFYIITLTFYDFTTIIIQPFGLILSTLTFWGYIKFRKLFYD